MEREHPQLWRDLPPRVREAVHAAGRRSSCPTSCATVTDEIGAHIDQLLDLKLMVIRHFEEHPELANRIFLDVGQQGAALHRQLRLRLRLPARASRWSFLTDGRSRTGGCCRSAA